MSERIIPDSECKQGKCAATTTGCVGKCALEHNTSTALMYPQGYVFKLESELSACRKELEEEREAHAQLQSRCYDQGGTFSNVFDECAALKKELEEAKKDIAVWEEYAGKQNDKVIALTAERDRLTKELEEKDRRIAELEATLSQEQVKMLREAMQDLKDEGVLKHSIIDKALAATAPKGE